MQEWIAVAIVRRPVGLAGFCAVEPFGRTFEQLSTPCTVRLGKEAATAVDVTIDEVVSLPKEYRVRFAGNDDRTAVERLRGSLIFVEEQRLPRRADNEFYHFELKGMDVFGDTDGEHLGTVVEVYNFPSADTIEVKLDRGGSVLLPLSEQATAAVDRTAKRIVIRRSFVEELLS